MMFYIGANDQRVSVVNETGAEVYHCDFRGFSAVITHFRGRIAAIAMSNSAGEVDKTMLKVLQKQMEKEKGFKSLTSFGFEPHLDARLLALSALVSAETGGKNAKVGKK